MYAIVDVNGKQYKMEAGRYLDMDKLPLTENDSITFDKVMMLIDGDTSKVGTPYLEGVSVKATLLQQRKAAKVLVYKMRCKKGYRRKNGHRQPISRVQVEAINA